MAKLPECSEYLSAVETPQLLKPSVLQGGHVVKRNDIVIRYTGGFCIVFPYETASKKYALRCWHAQVDNAQERTRLISEELTRLQLPYFVGFNYYEEGVMTSVGMQPVVVMDWVDALPLKDYLSAHLHDSSALRALAKSFLQMTKDLHCHSLAHGDLQHGNIMVKPSGDLVLVDYDSMYVPSLNGMYDDIKGLRGYQHPARWKNQYTSPKSDYFSELVIYTSIMALVKMPGLWTDLNMENTDTLIFTDADIDSKGTTNIFKVLEAYDELKHLVSALKQFMDKDSIDELQPLEEVVISPVDGISGKWNLRQPPVQKLVDNTPIIDGVAGRWTKKETSTESINIDSIKNKW